jgi:hypothetical protein
MRPGEPIELSHAGSLETAQEDDEITKLRLNMEFSGVGDSEPLTVSLALISPDEISGAVESSGTVLASISMQRGGQPEFDRSETCGE